MPKTTAVQKTATVLGKAAVQKTAAVPKPAAAQNPAASPKRQDLEQRVARLAADPAAVERAVRELSSRGAEKFRHAKALALLGERRPELLMPHLPALRELLHAENSIIAWSACGMIASLAAADARGAVTRMLDEYLAPIQGPQMIMAANIMAGAARICRARPRLAARIIPAILGVEQAVYATDECRNIAIGHAIEALGTLDERLRRRTDVRAFAARAADNSRPGTRKKAAVFLKQIVIPDGTTTL